MPTSPPGRLNTPSNTVPPSAIPKAGRRKSLIAGTFEPPVTGSHGMRVLSSTKRTLAKQFNLDGSCACDGMRIILGVGLWRVSAKVVRAVVRDRGRVRARVKGSGLASRFRRNGGSFKQKSEKRLKA